MSPPRPRDERSVHVFQLKGSIIGMSIMGLLGTPAAPAGLIFTTTSYDLAKSRRRHVALEG